MRLKAFEAYRYETKPGRPLTGNRKWKIMRCKIPKQKSVVLNSRCEELSCKCTDPQNSVGERNKLLKLPGLDSVARCVFINQI